MTRRALGGRREVDDAPLWRRPRWWGLGTALLIVLLAPLLVVANAVSGRKSDGIGGEPVKVGDPLTHPGRHLDWADEFDGTALDPARWMTCLSGYDVSKPCKGATDGEQQKYVPEQVRVADGSLLLTAERRPVEGLPYASGAVSTGALAGESFDRSRALFRPGVYIEARVRLAAGAGLWPAMWLMPKEPKEPYRPEIDVFEFGGGDQRLAQARLHAATPCGVERGEQHGQMVCYGELARAGTYFADDYRLFGIDWQPGRLTYYADGEPVLTVVGDAVPNEPMYLIFNLAVGGIMGGDITAAPDRATMAIDYVRAWRGGGPAPIGAGVGPAEPTGSATPPAPAPVSPSPSPSAPTETPTSAPTATMTVPAPPAAPQQSPAGARPPAPPIPAGPGAPPPGNVPNAPAPQPPAPQPSAPRPPATSAPPQQGDPWLEFVSPSAYNTVRGVITVKVRVNGPRERVQEVSFYLSTGNCNTPKNEAVWVGYDRDNDNDGIYVYTFDTHRLANGCNTISTVGIDAVDQYRYYPYNRVHLDVNVAN